MKKRLTLIGCMLAIGMIVGLTSCQDEMAKEDLIKVSETHELATASRTANLDIQEARGVVAMSSTLTKSVDWNGTQGLDSEDCDKLGDGPRTAAGWIHWIVTQGSDITEAELVLGGSGSGTYSPSKYGPVVEFFTPYFDVTTLAATLYFEGELGGNTQFVISDFCPGTERLEVSKTVVTEYTREHFWSITKKVDTEKKHKLNGYPKIWLYADGSGNEKATWTVDVKYESFTDRDWAISGVVTIKNTGTVDAVITNISDVLAGTPVTLDCGITLPYTLPAGATLTCSYSVPGKKEGNNVVTVTTQKSTYSDTKPIVWGAPTTEVNKTVNISDISDLFGTKALGTATAPNGASFTYDKDFAWADYGQDNCGAFQYDNTAKIVETNQSASASPLKVNVQCFVYETAYAKAEGNDALCFIPTFNNWGWTNKVSAPTIMRLYAGAGRCIGGTDVGYVEVDFNGSVTVDFKIDSPYGLKETHVYAGNTEFPQVKRGRNTVSTVAPGQYYIESPLAFPFWVIAHAVVGLPDPKFGPK